MPRKKIVKNIVIWDYIINNNFSSLPFVIFSYCMHLVHVTPFPIFVHFCANIETNFTVIMNLSLKKSNYKSQ